MNGHYVHFLITQDRAEQLGKACEETLPRIQRDFSPEITAVEVYDKIRAHRETLELVERFRDESETRSGGLYDLELFKCSGNYYVTSDSEVGLRIINMHLEKIEKELRDNGINPEKCYYFPDAIYELYRSARLAGEQEELNFSSLPLLLSDNI
ncbi:MAG: hypothetical protein WC533_01890 [Candidatus Pacearchaeota archaeon]